MRRPLLSVAVLTFALCAAAPAQQRSQLPDMGSSAGTVLSPQQQKEYGEMTLSQLRNLGYTLDDPLLADWIQGLGNRLGAATDKPDQAFTLFLLKDRQINAFATLGGYVAVNSGLVLNADNEDEVAGVLSHEFAHVTQQHVLRAVERAKKDSVPILLAMLGAIAVAQAQGGESANNGAAAALISAQGLMAQRQINYTRDAEAEADRIGIQTLARSGYDPEAMADFFEKLQSVIRVNQGGQRERVPDFLQDHPMTLDRIAEAKAAAERLKKNRVTATTTTPTGSRTERVDLDGVDTPQALITGNPLLPLSLQLDGVAQSTPDGSQFPWARERLRVLSANTPADAVREYQRLSRNGAFNDPQRYGMALAQLLNGQASDAATELAALDHAHPGNAWVQLALAQAQAKAGNHAAADALFESLLSRMPNNRAVALTYAGVLNERNTAAAGKRAQQILRPLLASAAKDPTFQTTFARTCEIAGDPVRAGEAFAEAAYLNGRPEQALVQLNTLKKRPDVDYYARVRIDARIAAITPTVLELRREGVKDEDLDSD